MAASVSGASLGALRSNLDAASACCGSAAPQDRIGSWTTELAQGCQQQAPPADVQIGESTYGTLPNFPSTAMVAARTHFAGLESAAGHVRCAAYAARGSSSGRCRR